MTDSPPSGPAYGRALIGFGVSLLVRDLERALAFATGVMQAELRFRTPAFAALRLKGHDYMLHQDETYKANAVYGLLKSGEGRGLGIELRVYDLDPDQAEARARAAGFTVLAGSMDKPGHGMRECVILDDEGFAWVPAVNLTFSPKL